MLPPASPSPPNSASACAPSRWKSPTRKDSRRRGSGAGDSVWKIVGEARARREREREALVVRGHSWGHRRRRRGRIRGGGARAPVTACGRLWGRLVLAERERGAGGPTGPRPISLFGTGFERTEAYTPLWLRSRLLFGLYGGAPVNTRSLHDGYVSLRVSVIVGVVAQFANDSLSSDFLWDCFSSTTSSPAAISLQHHEQLYNCCDGHQDARRTITIASATGVHWSSTEVNPP
ncbi:hypothetical protein DEO72_LG7g2938 [Vigna unguiculata]|uniref:Uncharacterized protein n=1 Tax=Vigna unguiculata TaxID=3917 RepID=A0A4D6MNB2_VIGUN|nr:hypothetical protein DEO72_LG7g2938 [Vigna unguiculata]